MREETVSRYINKLIKKVTSHMTAHYLDAKDPISVVGILATFKSRMVRIGLTLELP